MSGLKISDFFKAKPTSSATALGAGPSVPPQSLEDPRRSQRGCKRDVNEMNEQPSHARGQTRGRGRGVAPGRGRGVAPPARAPPIDIDHVQVGQDQSSERGRARGRGRGRSRVRAPPIVIDAEPSEAPRARAPPIDIDAEPSRASLASLALIPRSWDGTRPCRSEEPESVQQAAAATADRQAATPPTIEALEAGRLGEALGLVREAHVESMERGFQRGELNTSQQDRVVDSDSSEATSRSTPTTSPASSAVGAPHPPEDSLESQLVALELPPQQPELPPPLEDEDDPPPLVDQDFHDPTQAQHTTLKTAFEWNRNCFDVLSELDIAEGRDESDSLSRFVTAFSGSTWSSACSGIDSPCAALTDLRAGALQHLGVDSNVVMPRCLHAIEWDKQCLK